MSSRAYPHPEVEDLTLHRVLFALSDPTRMAIVAELDRGGERVFGDLLDGAIAKSTLSHHLKILREAGITNALPDGQRCVISLRARDLESRFPGLLQAVMAHNQAK
ncbi:MAG: helix-turn-helix domain-containing protein [Burkholderiaceae bacterium]